MLIAFCVQTQLWAVPAYPYPIEITQPDGSNLTILLKGDEFFHWTESEDGFVIVRNAKGIFEYVGFLGNDSIVFSGIKANDIERRDVKEIE